MERLAMAYYQFYNVRGEIKYVIVLFLFFLKQEIVAIYETVSSKIFSK
jgi:hypothetical protein